MKHKSETFQSLLVGSGVVILLGLGQALYGQAEDNLAATDRSVRAAFEEIYPEVYPVLREEFELGIEQNSTWDVFVGEGTEDSVMINALTYQGPMGGGGSASRWISNGLIDGSGCCNHRVVFGISDPHQIFSKLPVRGYTELIRVEVISSVPWGIFPGKQSVTVVDHGGDYNELYLSKLAAALERRGIAFKMK